MIHKRHSRHFITLASILLLGTSLVLSQPALAKHKKDRPDEKGPYEIGHTTVILTDPSRNLDGSTPPTGAGRYLYLDPWYPTDVKTEARIRYD